VEKSKPIPTEPGHGVTMKHISEIEAELRRGLLASGHDREHLKQLLDALRNWLDFENDPGVNQRIAEIIDKYENVVPIR
jgi:hypothetical protein